jgi:hypothetical protein
MSFQFVQFFLFLFIFDQYLPVGEAKQESMNQPKWGSSIYGVYRAKAAIILH